MSNSTANPVDDLLAAASSQTPMSTEEAEALLKRILANAVINHHARFESSLEAFAAAQEAEHRTALARAWDEGYDTADMMSEQWVGEPPANPYRTDIGPEHAFDDLPVIDDDGEPRD